MVSTRIYVLLTKLKLASAFDQDINNLEDELTYLY